MAEDLESRLKSHARAFEGLMSLIPAKEYYGKDESITSTQWNRKKQTKEERRAAKKAKLDPASHQTAKDVMDENARKRKRELEGEAEASSSDLDMDIEKEKPLQGLKTPVVKPKKQKTEKDSGAPEPAALTPSEKHKAIADKRRQKRELKKEKKSQKQQKEQGKKALQDQFSTTLTGQKDAEEKDDEEDDEDDEDDEDMDTTAFGEDGDDGLEAMDVAGLEDEPISTETPSSGQSNDSSAPSATSSTTSIVPPSTDGAAQKEKDKESKPFKYDPSKQEEYRSRLAAKLEELRAKRKADGPDGRPAKNRAELIETRRKKEAERKAAKKASRQLAKEDEERLKAEEQLARIRGASGSPSVFSVASTPEVEQNLAFGKVAWNDGQQLDTSLTGFLESRKKKGKSDPKTALEAAKKKQARLSNMDEDKRKDIEEKDAWLAAKKHAQGEKVFDDPKLLTKSVKRIEKEKSKSKQEWKERITGVAKGIAMKQKKREENLKKRRDEKGTKKGGKKGKNAKGKAPKKKVTKRPGFEGTFKARS